MKRRKETIKLLFFLIVILAFLTLIIIIVTKNQQIKILEKSRKDYTTVNFQECINYLEVERDRCYIQSLTATAERSKSIAYCELISKYVKGEKGVYYMHKCRDNILYLKALEALDFSLCYGITDTLLRKDCIDSLFNKQTRFNEKRELCNSLRNYEKKVICLEELYKEMKTYGVISEYCNQLSDKEKEVCLKIL